MARSLSILIIAFFLLLTLPLMIGIGGGLFGLAIGLVGGLIGIFFGLIGAVIGVIAWIFKTIFHILFGWSSGFDFFDFHPWFHFHGYFIAILLVLLFVVISKSKK
jgi:hypothetical protein